MPWDDFSDSVAKKQTDCAEPFFIKRMTSGIATLTNIFTASDAVKRLENYLGKLFNEGDASIYDKAMDSVYHTTHVGGGNLHRLFDGGHSLGGAWKACSNARPDDKFTEEVLGYFSALGHDLSSTVGLPLFTMTPEGYSSMASWLGSFGVSKSWCADLLHINLPELIAGSVGTLAVFFHWNSADIKRFSELAASIGISGVVAANPLAIILSVVGLARSYQLTKFQGKGAELIDGVAHGSIKSTLFLGTTSLIGGPAWVGLVAALLVCTFTYKKIDELNLSDFLRIKGDNQKSSTF